MPDREPPLSLWGIWWNAILLLRPAFSRLRTFMWFVTAVAGLTVRVDLLGVTSIVRALNLRPRLYTKLLDHFHSSGVKLDRLSALWAQAVLQLFPALLAHEVLKQVWAVAARFALARRHMVRDIHRAVGAPECSSPPNPATRLLSSYPDHEPNLG